MKFELVGDESDFELIRRCQSGDAAIHEPAFLELYERYRDRVFNTAYRVVGNATDAADVTQDVFLTLFRKIDEFQFGSRFFTWLYRVTVNLSIDRRRRAHAHRTTIAESSFEGGVLSAIPDDRADVPGSWSETDALEQSVQRSIDRLSPKLRAIVVLRYIENLSYGDIAETMDCSIGTVKSRLNRAHRSLADLLKPMVESMAAEGESP